MEPGEFEDLVARSQNGGHNLSIELLQTMRTHKVHQPELVVLHGGRLLSTCPRKLGDELATVMEQVFLAAIELGEDGWRDYCIKQLMKKFPSSRRVQRLKGLHKESLEKWDDAKKIYEDILRERPEDTVTQKRLIALHKQRGRNDQAVEEINKYLETFCTDPEVWHELAELYIEVGTLSRAAFCYEELLLSNPRSMYHVLTYAELMYSTGKPEDLETSRKYFSLAAYLDSNSIRALWGLVVANAALLEKDRANERMGQLQNYTVERLRHLYKAQKPYCKAATALLDGFVVQA